MENSKYYKSNEEVLLRFYQMPKILFSNQRYKGLSLGAKAMYSVLRDRLDLSIKNNWVDENGYVYLIFKTEPTKNDERIIHEKDYNELSLTELLGINKNTVTTYKKELTEYDLMVEKKIGQGKPGMIYVLKPDLIDGNVEKYETPKKQESRLLIIKNPDSQKLTGNDTDLSNTELSDTIFLSQINEEEFITPLDIIKNAREIESATKPINEFNEILKNCEYEVFVDNTAILQAIRMLYYSDKSLRVGSMSIPPAQVRDDLKLLKLEHIDYAINDYEVQSKEQVIQHPIAYLSRCIYNAIFQGDLKLRTEINFKGYK